MSDEVERRLLSVLDAYATSPFGNPIPGLPTLLAEDANKDALSTAADEALPDSFVRAADLEEVSPIEAIIVSINEIVQVEYKIMAKLSALNIVPGALVTVHLTDDGLVLTSADGEVVIPDELSHAICIRKA